MAEGFKLDLSYVMEDSDSKKKDTINLGTIETGFDEEESKKRKRTIRVSDNSSKRESSNKTDVTTENYAESYNETNNIIKSAIAQADELSYEIKQDIDAVRSSKTIKNKYTYLTNLTASASALINTKIAAIRELNSSITNAHRFELDRIKTLKADARDDNNDAKMMDLYSAFLNAPLGTYNPPSSPNVQDINVGINDPSANINQIEMVGGNTTLNSLTPEQARMRMESNPNIKTVVVFDQESGNRYFDVVDENGKSIPNYPRPDQFLLEDTTIDVSSGIARNRNINQVWPLIITGSGAISEY